MDETEHLSNTTRRMKSTNSISSSSRNGGRRRGNYNQFNDDEDDVPQFATFDDKAFTNNNHNNYNVRNNSGKQQGKMSPSNRTGNNYSYVSPTKMNKERKNSINSPPKTPQVMATGRNKMTPSPPTAAAATSVSSNKRKTSITFTKTNPGIINHYDKMVGEYDKDAASDYKWAKMQATNELTKSISQVVKNNNHNSPNPSIRKPNAGLVRSISAGSNDNRDLQNKKHSKRSMTPDEQTLFQQYQNYNQHYHNHHGGDNSVSSKDIRTRQRSRSPAPQLPRSTSASNHHNHSRTKSRKQSSTSRPIIISSSSRRNKHDESTNNTHRQPHLSKEEMKKRKYYQKKSFTFQTPLHELVSYRVNDFSTRAAFERVKPITIKDLENAVNSKNNNKDQESLRQKMNKLSPSPQYVELLDAMSKITTIRQLCWSPSVSREADPFFGWGEEDVDDDSAYDKNESKEQSRNIMTDKQKKKILLRNKRKEVMSKRFGLGCVQIDPEKYAQKTLLDHAPILTNVRNRLPMRSDVGFPRATEAEITLKQSEVAKEAQMEEVSPRLIVLLSSNDVGMQPDVSVDKLIDSKVLEKLKYRLPGMPFTGKELSLLNRMQKKSSIVLHNDYLERGGSMQKVLPDSCSVFAPPIDSVISSSEMWRLRPFSDRPVGMCNSVVAPIDVKFPVGNIEPLICTLALYCLPRETDLGSKTLRGKISEDYIFPAGEWGNQLQGRAGEILARQFGMKQSSNNGTSNGRRGVKKALFSFDPMALPQNEYGGIDSLYIVMNVQKVTHRDAGNAYINQSTVKNVNGFSKKTISGMFLPGSTSSLSSRLDASTGKKRAKEVFDAFGCQFTTPFCFGLVPLFPHDPETHYDSDKRLEWPNGISQCMSMFSHPIQPESHDAFIDRISKIAHTNVNIHSNIIDEVANLSSNSDMSLDDDSNIIAIASEDSVNSRSVGSRRMRPKLKFRKRHSSKRSFFDTVNIVDDDMHLIDGTAILYTSKIGPDFSQTLLQQPSLFDQANLDYHSAPRLLVDTCGDFAIMMNPERSTTAMKKRSNLIRLPQSSTPSGYSDSCEVREILYLPFQNVMSYDLAPFFSPRPSINLLYLYPSLIRKESNDHQEKGRNACYSVRVRLVKQKLEMNKETGAMSPIYVATESIYNPSPEGESLLQSVYTKIPWGYTGKHGKMDINRGIPLQDEFKLRLPDVLDGSHYLQFTLSAIGISDEKAGDSLTLSIIGDTLIPLSSSNTKETTCGKRVTTIIPDGLHRIQIENFQVQVKSRLASTIHISDPAVATVIRDFAAEDERMLLGKESELSGDYHQLNKIISKASTQSLYGNFSTLTFIHLRALVKIGMIGFDFSTKQLTNSNGSLLKIEFLKSLLRIIDRSKKLFQQIERENGTKRFIKNVLDTFDELALHQNGQFFSLPLSSQSMSNNSLESDQDVDLSGDQALEINENQEADYVVEDKRKLKLMYAQSVHSRYADNAVPFSRKAYGVSTIDRMKAEAEIYEEGRILTELYDDDETVITASTWQSHPHLTPTHLSNSFSINKSGTSQHLKVRTRSQVPDTTLLESDTVATTDDSIKSYTPFERARSMARRMNHVAQIFVAPCTAPNLEGSMQAPVRRTLSRIQRKRVPIEVRDTGLIGEYNQLHTKKNEEVRTVSSFIICEITTEYIFLV